MMGKINQIFSFFQELKSAFGISREPARFVLFTLPAGGVSILSNVSRNTRLAASFRIGEIEPDEFIRSA
jgi:hypothetical protein